MRLSDFTRLEPQLSDCIPNITLFLVWVYLFGYIMKLFGHELNPDN